MKILKKTSLLVLSAFMVFSMSACQKKTEPISVAKEVNTEFEAFVNSEFKDYIENDYISVQQLLAHPEKYDIDRSSIKVQLGEPWNDKQYEEDLKSLEESKKKLEAFDRAALNAEQQETYDILTDQIDLSYKLADKKFNYMGTIFNTMSGIQSNIMTLFTEFSIYSEQDLKDLIILMNDTKPYVESLLDFMRKQKEAGTFMSNYNVENLSEYCDRVISGTEGKEMVAIVQKNIEAYQGVDAKAKETYKQAVQEAFTHSIVPAYQSLKDTANELKSDDNNQLGLSYLENGKEYYELLFRNATGSSLSVEKAKSSLESNILRLLMEMSSLSVENTDAVNDYVSGKTTSGYHEYMDMLDALKEWEKDTFPEIEIPAYEAVSAPESTSDGVAAYYVIPRIDSNDVNKIRVNKKSNDVTSLNTLYTIAHEGMPGHLYQNNYAKQMITDPYRLVACNYLGYGEGYANYAAAMAMKVSKSDDTSVKIFLIDNDLNWAVVSLLDIGIHYEGWTKEEAVKKLDIFGLGSIVEPLYDTIQSSPAAYLPYGVGYFEILDMKKATQKKLGDKFNELEFNKALLKSGEAPFSVVQKNIDAYIESAK